jgi:hypothetical protein
MSRNKIILLVGFLVAIMPVLGFPFLWKNIFYAVAGISLVIMAVVGHVRRRSSIEIRREVVTETYVETGLVQNI